MTYLLVALGGVFGANARFLLATWVSRMGISRFPLGTFVINVSGSFLLGLGSTLVTHHVLSDTWRYAFNIGFLGAYTTFSTFEFENHSLLEDEAPTTAAIYTTSSLVIGLLALHLGTLVAYPP